VGENAGGDLVGTFTGTYNLIGDGSGVLSSASSSHNILGTVLSPVDPLLAPLGNYGGSTQTLALLPESRRWMQARTLTILVTIPSSPTNAGLRASEAASDIGAYESSGQSLHRWCSGSASR